MTSLLVFAALAINLAMAVDNTVYHIKPTFAGPCPHVQCRTLDMINPKQLLSGYWKRNVSLIFLPGTHKLSTEMEATELYSLDLKWKVFSGRVDINCENGAYISFSGSGRISFEGLHFSNCGGTNHRQYTMTNPGVFVMFIGVVTVSSCSFQGTKDYYAFRSYSSETILLNSTFTNSVEVDSVSKREGNLTISNCMFQGQYSQGGALYIKKVLRANITNSVFKSSITDEGSVHIKDSGVSFSNVVFRNNSAFYCAAVYIESSDVNITRAVFIDHMAHRHAVICAVHSILRISNASITHNVAKLNGTGGIFAASSTVLLDRVFLKENKGFYGGALYLSSSTLLVERAVFRDNQAALFGGALFAESSVANFQNSLFRNNSDSLGKAIASVKSIITPMQWCGRVSLAGPT